MPVLSTEAKSAAEQRDRAEALIAAIDARVSALLRAILHHPDFQKLESAWRGLHFLVSHTDTDEMLKIRVFNISKAELAKTLRRYEGTAWDQSPIFKKIYDDEFGQFGGRPYACLIGDYEFDQSAPDVALLADIAKVAAAAHAPFIAAAAPKLLQMASWRELADRRDVGKLLSTPEYLRWRTLRESEDSRYIGLAMPRFLARLPYGVRTLPVETLDFVEEAGANGQADYVWCNAAFAMAVNVGRSFQAVGWGTNIRGFASGGGVENLTACAFSTGVADTRCATEIALSDHREAELAQAGLMPLTHIRGQGTAVFVGAQSLHKPAQYDDPDASANARLAARLPYIFATCRFAHYLKCIVRDKIGTHKDREAMQRFLNDWIVRYVDPTPASSPDIVKARRPLAAAEVVVESSSDEPGQYSARLFLRPHYQLEGLTVALQLVTKLPGRRT